MTETLAAEAPARRTTDRLYEIDLLRILAALAVVVFHYTFSGYGRSLIDVAFPTISEASRYGYLGVDMFFTISGFVVLLSAWGRRPHQFVISRMVRLYPAYWVAVTLTAIVAVTLSAGLFHVSPVQYLANLTMFNAAPNIPNVDVVYWTLWAEIRFYALIFVLTCVGITRQRVLAMLWGWLALTGLIETGLLPRPVAGLLDLFVQSEFAHYFIAGMALGLVYRFGWSWSLRAILVLAFGNAVYRAIGFADAVGDRYHVHFQPAVIAGVIAAVFLLMTLISTRVTRRFAKPWFVVAGALTYPLYLIHAHIGFVLFNLLDSVVNRYVLLVGTIAVMCVAAYGIHALIERPFAPVFKRWLTRAAAAIPGLRAGS